MKLPRKSVSIRLSDEERRALEAEGESLVDGIRRVAAILARLRQMEREGMSDQPLGRALRIAEGFRD